MIRRRALKAFSGDGDCAPCEGIKVKKFDKNLQLMFREENGSRICCMASAEGISPSELIARTVTDQILKETL
jgi:hypothetical protein